METLLLKESVFMSDVNKEKVKREEIEAMEGTEKMKYEIAEELGFLDKVLE